MTKTIIFKIAKSFIFNKYECKPPFVGKMGGKNLKVCSTNQNITKPKILLSNLYQNQKYYFSTLGIKSLIPTPSTPSGRRVFVVDDCVVSSTSMTSSRFLFIVDDVEGISLRYDADLVTLDGVIFSPTD